MTSAGAALGPSSDPRNIPNVPLTIAPEEPDEFTRSERRWLADHEHREKRFLLAARMLFTPALLTITTFWLVFVVATLIASAWGLRPRWSWVTQPFHLSDTILGALLGATTIGIIGLARVVTDHLFPKAGAKQ